MTVSNTGRLKIGVLTTPVAPFSAVNTGFRTAKLIGADHFWLGDHFKGIFPTHVWNPRETSSARMSPNPDAYLEPSTVLARLAGRSKMQLGVGVTDPVRRSAADLARTYMTLHHLTGGRAVLGLGSGENQNTEPYGDTVSRSVSRLEETLRAVRLAWSADDALVDFTGEWTNWNGARFALPPFNGTTPPIWLAAQGPRMLRLAGTYGDGWIGPDDGGGPEVWSERAAKVAAAAKVAGKDVDYFDFACMADTILAPDRQRLNELLDHPVLRFMALIMPDSVWQKVGLEHPLGKGSLGLPDLDYDEFSWDQIDKFRSKTTHELFHAAFYTGTGPEVARRLEPIVEAGARHILLLDLTAAAGLAAAARAQLQTFRLVRRLRRLRPGRVIPAPVDTATRR